MTVRVVSALQAAARDNSAVAAGTPSIELMRRAGIGAARVLRARYDALARRGVVLFVGPGNNGGDGWVVAGELAAGGFPVRVAQVGEPRTKDAREARDSARAHLAAHRPFDGASDAPGVVVDALLGTGASGDLRADVLEAARDIEALRRKGVPVVSLDLPTGLDASTGARAREAVSADVTLSFGTVKRGHLVSRSACGEIVVIDIGLGAHADLDDGAPILVDASLVHALLPPIAADAHKGSRRKLLIVGGASGMAGAVALAARAALRSGVGMVRACVDHASLAPIQSTVVEATAIPWPSAHEEIAADVAAWPDAVLAGPGLGAGARPLVERWLAASGAPVVLDADALNAWAGDASSLGTRIGGRRAVVTPHVAEFARLAGLSVEEVLADRWDAGTALARTLGCCVLLKGVPTIISGPSGLAFVSAAGTPALATAGSGDVLGGIAATLLAQMADPLAAAACAAWAHGRAAEIAGAGRPLRGVTLADVLEALPEAWRAPTALREEGILSILPAVADA